MLVRLLVLVCLLPAIARGQSAEPPEPGPSGAWPSGGEVILDPELAGQGAGSLSNEGSELILDPELAGAAAGAAPETTVPAPSAQSAEMRVVLRSRFGVDLQWNDPRQDVLEATQLALFEAKLRRSERLAFTVGLRAQHRTLSRQRSTVDAGPVRYELDAVPTALHADVGVHDAVHVRVGYQGVHLGRFDVLGVSDVLSRYDLRSGPIAMPEQSVVAQPAVSVDTHLSQAITLRGVYVPFFAPHMVNVFEGDYALAPQRQADIDAGLDAIPTIPGVTNGERLTAQWRAALTRSGQARFLEGGFSAFAPDPSLSSPQAALRLTAHNPLGELGVTAASALEHLPTLRIDPQTDVPLVRYGRFGLLAIDGATAIGPAQLGVELAVTSDRALISVDANGEGRVRESDIAHAALRLEWIEGEQWVVAVEASGAYMLRDPGDGQKWLFSVERRFQAAAVGFIGYALTGIDLRLELGGGVLAGGTYLATPRVELRIWEQVYGEVGAYVMTGRGSPRLGDPTATLGSIYGDIDQVFVGLRALL